MITNRIADRVREKVEKRMMECFDIEDYIDATIDDYDFDKTIQDWIDDNFDIEDLIEEAIKSVCEDSI